MYEQLYNDFTTLVLPKVAEGLMVTKEYFMDLFGRFVTYITFTDIMWLALLIIFLIITFIATKRGFKKTYEKADDDDKVLPFIIFGVGMTICILLTMSIIEKIEDVIKDRYIPELRVYEVIKQMGDEGSRPHNR